MGYTAVDSGKLPADGAMIGGKGNDGLFHFLSVDNNGSLGTAAGAVTDGSGSITTGGTSQQIFSANTSRRWLLVQNISNAVLYVNFGAAAVVDSNSIKLNANASYESPAGFVTTATVTVIGATTGQKFVAKQYP